VADEFGAPFIDVDEWRDTPRRHRYVHGGFEDTHTRFSFYFPPVEEYSGRMVQFLEGGAGGHETLISIGYDGNGMAWLFDLAFDELGSYLVESNQGHFTGEGLGVRPEGTRQSEIDLYDASAESAIFSKHLAAEMYGAAPHHSYVYGVSGGGLRSALCLENRPDVWDGGSPHTGVHNTTHWSAWCLAWLVARGKFPQIIDAVEPGGSGNPFVDLSHAEREALAELYRRGYPRGAENQFARFSPWAFTVYIVIDEDPSYFEDFWSAPGYLGADDPHALSPYVVVEKTTVQEALPASAFVGDPLAQMHLRLATAGAAQDPSWGVRLALDLDDFEKLFMAKVTILTGKAAGRELYISGIDGNVVSPFVERAPDLFNDVAPGDELLIDNRDFVAFCHYHWYAIEGLMPGEGVAPQLEPWAVDGHPVAPQRSAPALVPPNPGEFAGKMIYVAPSLDNMVWPVSAGSYHDLVRRALGDWIDDQYRLWWVENSAHGAPEFIGPMQTSEKDPNVWLTRLVSYDSVTSQALRELVGWVEEGVAPRSYTGYEFTRDNELKLPPTAAARAGVQPVVSAQVNGGLVANVRVAETTTFTGAAEQPPGAGTIVRAEWDFEGRGTWDAHDDLVDGSKASITSTTTHAYDRPGTYFASYRVAAHCDGAKGKGLPIENLARVRVVVS
jgi:hypothetical protein